MSEKGRLMTNVAEIQRFALAGKAILTLKSLKTDDHLTYKIRANKATPSQKAGEVHFVYGLVRPETYRYVGMIKNNSFTLTRKSSMTSDNVRVKAIDWFSRRVLQCTDAQLNSNTLEVRHEGFCGRCGRELTHPDSIDRGIGPECWKHYSK